MTRCRSCNAPIRWAYTLKGKRIPIDAEPVQDGNLLVYVVAGGRLEAEHATELTPHDEPRYVSHFATCPNAAGHRR